MAKKDNKATKRTKNQCKIPFMRKKTHFFCKNELIYTINNPSVILEVSLSKFSYSLKMMSRNTFSEPQPDSASYPIFLSITEVQRYDYINQIHTLCRLSMSGTANFI